MLELGLGMELGLGSGTAYPKPGPNSNPTLHPSPFTLTLTLTLMSMIISRWEIRPPTTAIGRRTAARLERLAAPPPPTLSAPRPTAIATMAAQARFFTPVTGLRCTEYRYLS